MARTGRPRLFDREAAVRKAMVLFWRKGFESTSLADLRQALDCHSAASFYAAFGSKQALYRECLELYLQTCGESVPELENLSVSARQAMHNMLDRTIRMQTSELTPRGCMAVLSGLNCGEENQDIEQLALAVRERIREAVRRCVLRGVEQGEFTVAPDPETLATLLATFINGLSIQSRDGQSREQLLAAAQALMELWR